jgi:membrane-associated phospholipid phosphatase
MRTSRALALVLIVATADAAAAAPRARAHIVRHAAFVGAGAVTYLLSETALKSTLAPDACRWCAPPAFDRGARDALRWNDTGLADVLSNLDGFVLAPLVPLALTAGASWRDLGTDDAVDDGLAIAESAISSLLVDQAVKFAVGRERPFVHFAPPGRAHETDDDLSFYSGHTSTVFAFATAAGTVASRRHQPLAPLVWGLGLGFAATTGYLRIAADKHYATDVLCGLGVGSALGALYALNSGAPWGPHRSTTPQSLP